MTASTDLLIDGFGRVREVVHETLAGLTAEELATRLDAEANSIAWLVWHLTRVQDGHVAEVAETEQVWTARGFHDRSGLAFGPAATGYAHSSAEVAAVGAVPAKLLAEYHDAVCDATVGHLAGLADEDLGRVVDASWTPPVTLAVRLVSVLSDDLQHAGQAAFIRGILLRRR